MKPLKEKSKVHALYVNEQYKERVDRIWHKQEEPGFLDLIAIDAVHIKNREVVSHVGFYIQKNKMLHVNELVKYSCIENLSMYGHKIVGFYRYGKTT